MKKILFTLFALVLASGIAAQIPEPDFIGEVLAIHSDGTAEKLEKHNVKMRTGAGVYIAGLAVNKSKTKILVAGSQANVRFAADEPVNLIVRAVDNKTDPMSIVRVFAMKNNRKQRSAVISAVGSFNVTSNDMEYLPFTAEKYGENSYYLTFGDAPAGEYGIIVTNPNNVDEKNDHRIGFRNRSGKNACCIRFRNGRGHRVKHPANTALETTFRYRTPRQPTTKEPPPQALVLRRGFFH